MCKNITKKLKRKTIIILYKTIIISLYTKQSSNDHIKIIMHHVCFTYI